MSGSGRFTSENPANPCSCFNDPTPRPHLVMTTSVIMTLPVVVLFLALERFLEKGLSAGDVKG
jgi:ABC-type glycerol-3-phosphate transport system permease component